MSEVREFTEDEVRKNFINSVRDLVDYWNNVNEKDGKKKLSGLAFSILTLLDGGHGDMPAFIVAPYPHIDDMRFNIEEGENYYPDNNDSYVKCDIAGSLHEVLYDNWE
jgi:hypothetical protein